MSEIKTTPGPWKVSPTNHDYITSDKGLVAMAVDGYAAFSDEAEANARLLACTPELVQTLQWAMTCVRRLMGTDAALNVPLFLKHYDEAEALLRRVGVEE